MSLNVDKPQPLLHAPSASPNNTTPLESHSPLGVPVISLCSATTSKRWIRGG